MLSDDYSHILAFAVHPEYIDFDEDIYGKNIKVNFYEFLRPEKKFPDLTELKNQMGLDKRNAANILKRL